MRTLEAWLSLLSLWCGSWLHLALCAGASVDQPDSNQLTPLHRATMADNRVAAQILLQWGADVLAENNELRTPLKLVPFRIAPPRLSACGSTRCARRIWSHPGSGCLYVRASQAQSMAHNKTVEVLQQHAREEAEMMMSVRAELTEKRKQEQMASAGTVSMGV